MTVHLEAKPGDLAPAVLLPGDPLRAQFIAETYLQDAVCHNRVRGMLGYTGTYKGARVSVQATGMGMPSASIYIHELLEGYGVRTLIRVGTCGAIRADLPVRDLVLAQTASTDSAMFRPRFGHAQFAPAASFELLEKAHAISGARVGGVFTSDTFYPAVESWWHPWAEHGVLAVEMETAALYTLAARRNARALSVLTVSDNLVTGEQTTSAERQTGFGQAAVLALELLVA